MKKALSIPVALLGALLTVGCQTEKMPVEEVAAGSRTLRVIADSDDTRTSIFQDEETGKYQVRWDETDRLFLVEMIYANMTDDIEHAAWGYRAEPTTLEDDGRRAIFDFELEDNQEFLPENEVFRYIGFYPSYQSIVRPGQEFTVEDWENFWEEEYTSYHVMLVGDISSYQHPRAESFDPNSDVLISRMVESAVQPDELHLQFARIGSIVKITLKDLPPGYYVYSGKLTTGSSWQGAGSFLYDPQLERVLSNPYANDGTEIEFSPRDVVVNDAGEAVIWLRTLSGKLTDSFAIQVTLSPDGETPSMKKYEKVVDLASQPKSISFQEGGLTVFSVRMEEASPLKFTSETLAYFPDLDSDRPALRIPKDYYPSYVYSYDQEGFPFLFESQYEWEVSVQYPDDYDEDSYWLEAIETAGGCWLQPLIRTWLPQEATLVLTCKDDPDVDPIEIPVEGYNVVTLKLDGEVLEDPYDHFMVMGQSYTLSAEFQAPSWLKLNEESFVWEVGPDESSYLSYEADGAEVTIHVGDFPADELNWISISTNLQVKGSDQISQTEEELNVYCEFRPEPRSVPLLFNEVNWHKQTLWLTYDEEDVTIEADLTGLPEDEIASIEWSWNTWNDGMSIEESEDKHAVTITTNEWINHAELELIIVLNSGRVYYSTCVVSVMAVKIMMGDTRLYGEPVEVYRRRSYIFEAIQVGEQEELYDFSWGAGTGRFFQLYQQSDPMRVELRAQNHGKDDLFFSYRSYYGDDYTISIPIEVK